ncbi:MAG: hypothetical protein AB9873_00845 [Syntrophobacteraceae bacterium]
MDISLVNLFAVAVVAFTVPFVLGFFPQIRIPSVVIELLGGILIGPAVLGYRRHLGTREALVAGFLQATNLSFIVVAVEVGHELGRLREMNATALVFAGLLSAVLFPVAAQMLLGGSDRVIETERVGSDELLKERL